MKTESNIKPSSYTVEQCGDTADVILCENIVEEERDGETVYTYDEYRATVPYRDTLADAVGERVAAWLDYVKTAEKRRQAAEIRAQRDKRLAACDWTLTADSPLPPEQQDTWKIYRQALRDVPEQAGFPESVEWPAEP